ncbi:MAG: phosphatase PAP2 family protein [Pseudomonadota bacterium]
MGDAFSPLEVGGFSLRDVDHFPDKEWSVALTASARATAAVRAIDIPLGTLDPHMSSDPAVEIKDIIALRNQYLSMRASEIADQRGAFDHYFMAMLGMSPSISRPVATMVAFGIELGGMIGLEHKLHHNVARPVQRFPGLMPFLPTPPHASFPSNHATQAFLVAQLLTDDLSAPDGWAPYLSAMATRIAIGREIGGVHYRSDSLAGRALGTAIHDALMASTAKVHGKTFREHKAEAMADLGCAFKGNVAEPDIFAGIWDLDRMERGL